MKKVFTKFILIEGLIMTVAVVLLCIAAFSYGNRKIDPVILNDHVQTVKEHWNDGAFGETKLADTDLTESIRSLMRSAKT